MVTGGLDESLETTVIEHHTADTGQADQSALGYQQSMTALNNAATSDGNLLQGDNAQQVETPRGSTKSSSKCGKWLMPSGLWLTTMHTM